MNLFMIMCFRIINFSHVESSNIYIYVYRYWVQIFSLKVLRTALLTTRLNILRMVTGALLVVALGVVSISSAAPIFSHPAVSSFAHQIHRVSYFHTILSIFFFGHRNRDYISLMIFVAIILGLAIGVLCFVAMGRTTIWMIRQKRQLKKNLLKVAVPRVMVMVVEWKW